MKAGIKTKKVIFSLVLLIISLGILSGCGTEESDNAYKEDGIVYCYNVEPGWILEKVVKVDGKEYLVVDDDSIEEAIEGKERVCTSHVTDMSSRTETITGIHRGFGGPGDDGGEKDVEVPFLTRSYAKEIDITDWDVSNVENMSKMLGTLEYSVSDFNQSIGNWDVSNVEDMSGMFFGVSLFNRDISDWDVSNVEKMSQDFPHRDIYYGMFEGAELFNQDLSDWNVSNVEKYIGFDGGAESWQDEYKPEFE